MPPGRPRKEINWDEFDKLCHIQCSLREIASWFDCSEDTIENAVLRDKGCKFSEYFEQKRGRGKIALRRKMFDAAMSGDKTLLIWLSKQYLDMSEKQVLTHTAEQKKLNIIFENETQKNSESGSS